MTRTFYAVLANTLLASLTNNVVWFAVTFWVYLETKSVVTTSVMAGIFTGTIMLSGIYLGSLVDRFKKKKVMAISTIASLCLYIVAFSLYSLTPKEEFKHADSVVLWVFIVLALFGAMAGNLRAIALSTLVTIMVKEEDRDKGNGMVGTLNGVSFLIASIFSGLGIGYIGMYWTLVLVMCLTFLALLHILSISIPEKEIIHTTEGAGKVDIRGTIRVIRESPGLFPLIFFNTFNNFLGGVFMSLMDPYGLSLVSVKVWGVLWGFLSLGFIIGGIVVSKTGLGPRPLRTLFICNTIMWTICIFFTIQPSIILLSTGMFIYLCLIPVVEATEQTILQRLIPLERQGRVFGFSQSFEQIASPITAFVIGPIAQIFFIPFMTDGKGAEWIGPWFGTGLDRGLALLFTLAGVIGLTVTLFAFSSRAYKVLSKNYHKSDPT